MLQRCHHADSVSYKYYGARGIKVCDRWKDDYDAFYDDMGPRPQGCTLDRIDNAGDYTPENCQWSLVAVQNRNKRSTPQRTIGDETKTLAEWARDKGVCRERVAYRLKTGLSLEEALDPAPLRPEAQHGTLARYGYLYKCRCPLCKKTMSDYQRARRVAAGGLQ